MSSIKEIRGAHRFAMTQHECPDPGCHEMVDRSRLACPKHWRRVPKELRDELWNAYREGAGRPRHTAALVACIDYLRGQS